MFTRKNVLISLAVAVLLAGCGGGSDSPAPAASAAAGTGAGAGAAAGTGAGAAAGAGAGASTGVVAPTTDAKLAGTLVLAADQVVFGTVPPSAIALDAFTTKKTDGTAYGAFGQAKGTNAPLTAFGYRVRFDQTVAGVAETKRGRLAFELQDQGTTAQEVLRIEIDQVDYAVSDTGVFSVTVPATAKLYVFAKNSAGQTASVSTAAAATLVKNLGPVDAADTTSFGLVFDVDAAVGAAIAAATGANATVLSSVKNFTAAPTTPFEVALTLSAVNMTTGTGTALTGKPITVDGSGVAGVTGGGVPVGYLQVE